MVAIGWRKRKVVNKNKLSVEEYLILKQSLDQITPPEQENVSYSGNGTAGQETNVRPTPFFFQMPPQRTWVGLTEEDIKELKDANFDLLYGARWAERKLREKNGG